MSHTVKIAENDTHVLKIVQDDDLHETPRDWDNLGKMICWHSRYNLGDDHNYSDSEDFLNSLADDFVDDWQEVDDEAVRKIISENYLILPLYLYDHSGITMNTTGFSCRWDSGQVGWIYMSHEDIVKEYGSLDIEKAKENLIAEVKTYDMYLRGEVYGFQLIKKDEDGEELETIDSCWGFYGLDYIEGEITSYIGNEHQELVGNLKWAN